jgi:lipopolysaccharide/colanic/teichoic acid biosynthesis glycosyltransferase
VLPEKLRLASLYVDTVSFWGDLRLILRTLAALMTDPPTRADAHRELR